MAKGTRTAKAVSIAKKAASTAKRTSKRSGRKPDLKRHIENVEKAFEELKRENEGKGFTFIAADEIERKLRTSNDPEFAGWGWSDTTPGGNVTFSISVYNPGPSSAGYLYVHAWIGSGIVDPWSNTFLLDVDTRFPRLTKPDIFPEASIAPLLK